MTLSPRTAEAFRYYAAVGTEDEHWTDAVTQGTLNALKRHGLIKWTNHNYVITGKGREVAAA